MPGFNQVSLARHAHGLLVALQQVQSRASPGTRPVPPLLHENIGIITSALQRLHEQFTSLIGGDPLVVTRGDGGIRPDDVLHLMLWWQDGRLTHIIHKIFLLAIRDVATVCAKAPGGPSSINASCNPSRSVSRTSNHPKSAGPPLNLERDQRAYADFEKFLGTSKAVQCSASLVVLQGVLQLVIDAVQLLRSRPPASLQPPPPLPPPPPSPSDAEESTTNVTMEATAGKGAKSSDPGARQPGIGPEISVGSFRGRSSRRASSPKTAVAQGSKLPPLKSSGSFSSPGTVTALQRSGSRSPSPSRASSPSPPPPPPLPPPRPTSPPPLRPEEERYQRLCSRHRHAERLHQAWSGLQDAVLDLLCNSTLLLNLTELLRYAAALLALPNVSGGAGGGGAPRTLALWRQVWSIVPLVAALAHSVASSAAVSLLTAQPPQPPYSTVVAPPSSPLMDSASAVVLLSALADSYLMPACCDLVLAVSRSALQHSAATRSNVALSAQQLLAAALRLSAMAEAGNAFKPALAPQAAEAGIPPVMGDESSTAGGAAAAPEGVSNLIPDPTASPVPVSLESGTVHVSGAGDGQDASEPGDGRRWSSSQGFGSRRDISAAGVEPAGTEARRMSGAGARFSGDDGARVSASNSVQVSGGDAVRSTSGGESLAGGPTAPLPISARSSLQGGATAQSVAVAVTMKADDVAAWVGQDADSEYPTVSPSTDIRERNPRASFEVEGVIAAVESNLLEGKCAEVGEGCTEVALSAYAAPLGLQDRASEAGSVAVTAVEGLEGGAAAAVAMVTEGTVTGEERGERGGETAGEIEEPDTTSLTEGLVSGAARPESLSADTPVAVEASGTDEGSGQRTAQEATLVTLEALARKSAALATGAGGAEGGESAVVEAEEAATPAPAPAPTSNLTPPVPPLSAAAAAALAVLSSPAVQYFLCERQASAVVQVYSELAATALTPAAASAKKIVAAAVMASATLSSTWIVEPMLIGAPPPPRGAATSAVGSGADAAAIGGGVSVAGVLDAARSCGLDLLPVPVLPWNVPVEAALTTLPDLRAVQQAATKAQSAGGAASASTDASLGPFNSNLRSESGGGAVWSSLPSMAGDAPGIAATAALAGLTAAATAATTAGANASPVSVQLGCRRKDGSVSRLSNGTGGGGMVMSIATSAPKLPPLRLPLRELDSDARKRDAAKAQRLQGAVDREGQLVGLIQATVTTWQGLIAAAAAGPVADGNGEFGGYVYGAAGRPATPSGHVPSASRALLHLISAAAVCRAASTAETAVVAAGAVSQTDGGYGVSRVGLPPRARSGRAAGSRTDDETPEESLATLLAMLVRNLTAAHRLCSESERAVLHEQLAALLSAALAASQSMLSRTGSPDVSTPLVAVPEACLIWMADAERQRAAELALSEWEAEAADLAAAEVETAQLDRALARAEAGELDDDVGVGYHDGMGRWDSAASTGSGSGGAESQQALSHAAEALGRAAAVRLTAAGRDAARLRLGVAMCEACVRFLVAHHAGMVGTLIRAGLLRPGLLLREEHTRHVGLLQQTLDILAHLASCCASSVADAHAPRALHSAAPGELGPHRSAIALAAASHAMVATAVAATYTPVLRALHSALLSVRKCLAVCSQQLAAGGGAALGLEPVAAVCAVLCAFPGRLVAQLLPTHELAVLRQYDSGGDGNKVEVEAKVSGMMEVSEGEVSVGALLSPGDLTSEPSYGGATAASTSQLQYAFGLHPIYEVSELSGVSSYPSQVQQQQQQPSKGDTHLQAHSGSSGTHPCKDTGNDVEKGGNSPACGDGGQARTATFIESARAAAAAVVLAVPFAARAIASSALHVTVPSAWRVFTSLFLQLATSELAAKDQWRQYKQQQQEKRPMGLSWAVDSSSGSVNSVSNDASGTEYCSYSLRSSCGSFRTAVMAPPAPPPPPLTCASGSALSTEQLTALSSATTGLWDLLHVLLAVHRGTGAPWPEEAFMLPADREMDIRRVLRELQRPHTPEPDSSPPPLQMQTTTPQQHTQDGAVAEEQVIAAADTGNVARWTQSGGLVGLGSEADGVKVGQGSQTGDRVSASSGLGSCLGNSTRVTVDGSASAALVSIRTGQRPSGDTGGREVQAASQDGATVVAAASNLLPGSSGYNSHRASDSTAQIMMVIQDVLAEMEAAMTDRGGAGPCSVPPSSEAAVTQDGSDWYTGADAEDARRASCSVAGDVSSVHERSSDVGGGDGGEGVQGSVVKAVTEGLLSKDQDQEGQQQKQKQEEEGVVGRSISPVQLASEAPGDARVAGQIIGGPTSIPLLGQSPVPPAVTPLPPLPLHPDQQQLEQQQPEPAAPSSLADLVPAWREAAMLLEQVFSLSEAWRELKATGAALGDSPRLHAQRRLLGDVPAPAPSSEVASPKNGEPSAATLLASFLRGGRAAATTGSVATIKARRARMSSGVGMAAPAAVTTIATAPPKLILTAAEAACAMAGAPTGRSASPTGPSGPGAASTLGVMLLSGCEYAGCTMLAGASEVVQGRSLICQCERVSYCSATCQMLDWMGGHHQICRSRPKKMTAAGPVRGAAEAVVGVSTTVQPAAGMATGAVGKPVGAAAAMKSTQRSVGRRALASRR